MMCTEAINGHEKVMVNGRVHLPHVHHSPVDVERGMKIVDKNGKGVGMVGGLIVNSQRDQITYILLCQLPVTAVYPLIPLNLIARIEEETIYLTVQCDDIKALAVYQPV
jgi:hypothetical protein